MQNWTDKTQDANLLQGSDGSAGSTAAIEVAQHTASVTQEQIASYVHVEGVRPD